MAIKNLTHDSVVRAIAEYDRIGRSEFLKIYGFGRADEYILVHGGRYYDSKAIVGVAHFFQEGVRPTANELRGGLNGARRHLENLNFTVVAQRRGSFVLTLDPADHPWSGEGTARIQQGLSAASVTHTAWPYRPPFSIRPGDRLFLFLEERSQRGLIGSGHVSTDLDDDHSVSDVSGFHPGISIAWDTLLATKEKLPLDVIQQGVPELPRISNGGRLDGLQTLSLDALWQDHVDGALLSLAATDDSTSEIEASYSYGYVRRRNHQRRFKNLLLRVYKPECAICGFDQLEILEAAHIVADSSGGPSSVENGRLLCPNHHRAHDSGLFHLYDGKPVWHRKATEFLAPVRPNR